MTTEQRQSIVTLRSQNYSYSFIGKALGLSLNTVKSICRRKNIEPNCERKSKAEKQQTFVCKNCYTIFVPERNNGQMFCSESCRREWWKANRKILKK